MLTRRQFLATAAGVSTLAVARSAPGGPVAPVRRVLFIIGDDVGWIYHRFMGHPLVQTPALDELAAGGACFTRGMSEAPKCQPSIQSILTGLKQRDLEHAGTAKLNLAASYLLPRALRDAGWRTLHTGKWWEGLPLLAGFTDEDHALPMVIGRKTLDPIYEFWDAAEAESQPWLVWYAPQMPHLPNTAPLEYLDRYATVDVSGEWLARKKGARYCRAYLAMMTWFDATVGALVDGLIDRGIRDDTLIIYASDNGWALQDSKDYFSFNGLATPVLVNWPGQIAPFRSTALVSLVDLLPTILDYAGVPTPALPDALSLRGLCAHGGAGPWRQWLPLNWRPQGCRAALDEDGFLLYADQRGTAKAVYDIVADPDEAVPLLHTGFGRAVVDGYLPLLNAWWRDRIPLG